MPTAKTDTAVGTSDTAEPSAEFAKVATENSAALETPVQETAPANPPANLPNSDDPYRGQGGCYVIGADGKRVPA